MEELERELQKIKVLEKDMGLETDISFDDRSFREFSNELTSLNKTVKNSNIKTITEELRVLNKKSLNKEDKNIPHCLGFGGKGNVADIKSDFTNEEIALFLDLEEGFNEVRDGLSSIEEGA